MKIYICFLQLNFLGAITCDKFIFGKKIGTHQGKDRQFQTNCFLRKPTAMRTDQRQSWWAHLPNRPTKDLLIDKRPLTDIEAYRQHGLGLHAYSHMETSCASCTKTLPHNFHIPRMESIPKILVALTSPSPHKENPLFSGSRALPHHYISNNSLLCLGTQKIPSSLTTKFLEISYLLT